MTNSDSHEPEKTVTHIYKLTSHNVENVNCYATAIEGRARKKRTGMPAGVIATYKYNNIPVTLVNTTCYCMRVLL